MVFYSFWISFSQLGVLKAICGWTSCKPVGVFSSHRTYAFSFHEYSKAILSFCCMVPGTPSRRLSALHLSWPSFPCLMFLCFGPSYFVTGLYSLFSRWGAKSHTWSSTNTFRSTLGNRWTSHTFWLVFTSINTIVFGACLLLSLDYFGTWKLMIRPFWCSQKYGGKKPSASSSASRADWTTEAWKFLENIESTQLGEKKDRPCENSWQ